MFIIFIQIPRMVQCNAQAEIHFFRIGEQKNATITNATLVCLYYKQHGVRVHADGGEGVECMRQ